MHEMVMGLFIDRYEFGLQIYPMKYRSETPPNC
jgi:hypothetical protein